MFVLLFITVASKNKITIDQVSVILLGVIYIGFGFNYMIEARLAEHGLFWTIMVLFVFGLRIQELILSVRSLGRSSVAANKPEVYRRRSWRCRHRDDFSIGVRLVFTRSFKCRKSIILGFVIAVRVK